MQKYYFGIFLGISCIVLAVVGVQFYHVVVSDRLNVPANGVVTSGEGNATSTDKIKADVFSGVLQEVNTGCFADGECYVVVGGKRVTALTGMRINPQPVGTVQGVPGFGDLESYIGSTVEVYAQENTDGTYTLYGSEGFYIKLMPVGIGDGSKPPVVAGGCMVGGCSGQLCVDESEGGRVTTCEYAEYYACFQTAKCERQTTGQCGWTDTPELKQCLVSKKGTAE
jgi:eight-cysteine-cluster-containing protein